MILRFVKRVRKSGGIMIISIPKDVIGAGDIKEGDYLEIKLKHINKKSMVQNNTKYLMPDDLKKAIIDILNYWYGLELIIADTDTLDCVWITPGKIKTLMEDKEIYVIEDIDNIEIKIGNYLTELGFIDTNRTKYGNERRIVIDILKTL